MKFYAYYVIKGKKELLEFLLSKVDEEFASIFYDGEVFENSEGGRTAWASNEHTTRVKLLYLTYLRCEYLQTVKEYEYIFETDEISVALFDRWWTIERFVMDETTESYSDEIAKYIDHVKETGNACVDSWIQRLKNKHT